MLNVAVLLSGRGSNFIAIHEAILRKEIKNARIACVISNKSDAAGLEYAKQAGLDAIVLPPKNYANRLDYDKAILDILKEKEVGLICLAGYMRIVTESLVDAYFGRMMNIHPSLLPAFPGISAQQQALDYGVRYAGCTVHFVDGGMDSGPIILQAIVDVLADDTEESLAIRILREEHKIYPKAVDLFAEGKLAIKGRKVVIK
jgi:phosphoribosylglycinamide formyltransferase-1